MAVVLAQVELKATSGLPRDSVVNTFHFDDGGDPHDVTDALIDFYCTGAADHNLAGWLSPTVADAGHEIKVYDLADAVPRSPMYVASMSFVGLTGGNPSDNDEILPLEVAVCLSWKTDPIAGIPNGRLRNRIYFGPFGYNNGGTRPYPSDPDTGRPDTPLINDMIAAATRLVNWAGPATWAVYSPTRGAVSIIEEIWVDNEYDTQRRRGRDATARTTYRP